MYSIGLNIDLASVGWAVIDDHTGEIIDLGVSLFTPKDSGDNQERRDARGARRVLRRRRTRLQDAQKILATIECYPEKQSNQVTPYELRVKGLSDKLSKADIYRVVTHIVKKRGISFLDENETVATKKTENYKAEVLQNTTLLESMTPGEIQLRRLQEKGRVRSGRNQQGEHQLNVFPVSSYAVELERILTQQQHYYPEITADFIQAFVRPGLGAEAGLVYRKRPYYHGPGNQANQSQHGRWVDFEQNGRPAENIFAQLIGNDLQGELRASTSSLTAQKFNLFNDLANLKLPREDAALTQAEKMSVLNYLMTEKLPRFGPQDLAKLLGYSRDEITGWRVDKNERPEIHSLKIYRAWRQIFENYGIDLNQVSVATIDALAQVLTLNTALDGIINTLALELPLLNEDLKKVVVTNFKELRQKEGNSSWHRFSLKTMQQLIPLMLAQSLEQNTALEQLNIKVDLGETYAAYQRLPIQPILTDVFNPTVNKAMGRTLHIFNALIARFGKDKISHVTIEMPRDSNQDEKKRTMAKIQKANAQRKTNSEVFFLTQSGWSEDKFQVEVRKKSFATKLGYYYEQRGRCAYSGEPIEAEMLLTNATEIDHVIPLAISLDDSLSNKVLVTKKARANKGQRTPYQAYMDGANLGQTWQEYQAWVNLTYQKKHKRTILLETRDIYNSEVREKFIERNLNDTRYASRVVLNTLESFFYTSGTKVQVVQGSFTHTLRKKWGNTLEKSRETHCYHAVDAVLCAVQPFVKLGRYTYQLDQFGANGMLDTMTGEIIPAPILQKMKNEKQKNYVLKWANFSEQLAPAVLYPRIKFNHQVDRKSNRKISDATLYSTRKVPQTLLKRGQETTSEETYIIGKIKDIYSLKGWQEFQKKKDTLLAKENDPQTYAILCQIAAEYPDFIEQADQSGKSKRLERSPFARYCELNEVQGVQKYSKKGNGPVIRSLKYYDKKLGNHINITRDDEGQLTETTKHGKQVVLLSLNPWRTDVYYNQAADQFELLGIKYNHLKYVQGIYGVAQADYTKLKQVEGIGAESQFCFSLYRKDGVVIEFGEERFEGLFHSRSGNNLNYAELKPIDKLKWDANEVVPIFGKVTPNGQFVKGLKPGMTLVKFNTNHLGQRYYVTQEELRDIL